jgi:hypothetical protein
MQTAVKKGAPGWAQGRLQAVRAAMQWVGRLQQRRWQEALASLPANRKAGQHTTSSSSNPHVASQDCPRAQGVMGDAKAAGVV